MNLPVYRPLTDIEQANLDQMVHSQTWIAVMQFLENRKVRHAENAINKLEVEWINRMQEDDDLIEELNMVFNPPKEPPQVEMHPKNLEDYMP